MEKYTITNTVQAEPMTRLAYIIYRGWQLPDDESGDDAGYFILKECGNESWQPKEVFERSAVLISNEGGEDEEHF